MGRPASVGGIFFALLGFGCSTYQEYIHRDKVPVVVEIDSVPQGAEVYLARTPSVVAPGEPGGEWVAKGGFSFMGRTPLQVEDEIFRSTKGVRKMSGGVVIYETTGIPVYLENTRRIVLLKAGYKAVDITERIGSETRLRLMLDRTEGSAPGGEAETRGPEVLPGTQGRLSIVSVPSPAEVQIDGRYIGETPAAVQLPPGTHQLLLRRPGHADWKREIEIHPASDQKVSATFEKEGGEEKVEGKGKSP